MSSSISMSDRIRKRRSLYRLSEYCSLCGAHMTLEQATLDHILPRSMGGRNSLDNLRLAHRKCNARRGNQITREDLEVIKTRGL